MKKILKKHTLFLFAIVSLLICTLHDSAVARGGRGGGRGFGGGGRSYHGGGRGWGRRGWGYGGGWGWGGPFLGFGIGAGLGAAYNYPYYSSTPDVVYVEQPTYQYVPQRQYRWVKNSGTTTPTSTAVPESTTKSEKKSVESTLAQQNEMAHIKLLEDENKLLKAKLSLSEK